MRTWYLTTELPNLYLLSNIVRLVKWKVMSWLGHVPRMGVRNACNILVIQSERKKEFRRRRLRWKDTVIMDLKGIWQEIVDWLRLAQDSVQ